MREILKERPVKTRRPVRCARARVTMMVMLLSTMTVPDWATAQPDARDTGSAYKGWTTSSLVVRGLDEDLSKELAKGLALSGQRKLVRTQRPVFYPRILEEDLDRARLFLVRRGYPYARIRPRFRPGKGERDVIVSLDVQRGPPVIVDALSLQGFPTSLRDEAHSRMTLQPGSVFSELKLDRSVRSLETLLLDSGHARAIVERKIEKVDSTHVRIAILAEPGAVYRFDDVAVESIPDDLAILVRKTIDIKRGEVYSPSTMVRAQDNLRLLGLFRQIRLHPEDAGPQMLILRADLLPRRSRTVEFGVAYWTEDLLKVRARWEHRNLFGGGRGMAFETSVSRFLQGTRASFWWPALFGPRTRGVVGASVERQREDSYNLLSSGLDLGARFRPTLLTTFRAGIAVSLVDVDIKTAEIGAFTEEGGLLTVLSLGWNRDSSNDRVYPTRGAVTWIRAEWAPPGSVTESYFVLIESAAASYLRLVGETVLAGRLGGGAAWPTGESVDLLPNKRFYAGGATSMRGFGRRKLGPLDGSGAPLGGEAKVEASFELRFPILWRFKGALFVDSGQVWSKWDHMSIDDVEVAVGSGLMVLTPVGPVRADAGFRVTEVEPREPNWVLHVVIGHPY